MPISVKLRHPPKVSLTRNLYWEWSLASSAWKEAGKPLRTWQWGTEVWYWVTVKWAVLRTENRHKDLALIPAFRGSLFIQTGLPNQPLLIVHWCLGAQWYPGPDLTCSHAGAPVLLPWPMGLPSKRHQLFPLSGETAVASLEASRSILVVIYYRIITSSVKTEKMFSLVKEQLMQVREAGWQKEENTGRFSWLAHHQVSCCIFVAIVTKKSS